MIKPTTSKSPTCAACNTEMVLRSRFNKRFGRKRYAGSYFRCLECGQTMGLDVWQQACADQAFLDFMLDTPSPPADLSLDDLDFDFSELDDLISPPSAKPVASPLKASQRSNVIVLATHPFWISRHRRRC